MLKFLTAFFFVHVSFTSSAADAPTWNPCTKLYSSVVRGAHNRYLEKFENLWARLLAENFSYARRSMATDQAAQEKFDQLSARLLDSPRKLSFQFQFFFKALSLGLSLDEAAIRFQNLDLANKTQYENILAILQMQSVGIDRDPNPEKNSTLEHTEEQRPVTGGSGVARAADEQELKAAETFYTRLVRPPAFAEAYRPEFADRVVARTLVFYHRLQYQKNFSFSEHQQNVTFLFMEKAKSLFRAPLKDFELHLLSTLIQGSPSHDSAIVGDYLNFLTHLQMVIRSNAAEDFTRLERLGPSDRLELLTYYITLKILDISNADGKAILEGLHFFNAPHILVGEKIQKAYAVLQALSDGSLPSTPEVSASENVWLHTGPALAHRIEHAQKANFQTETFTQANQNALSLDVPLPLIYDSFSHQDYFSPARDN